MAYKIFYAKHIENIFHISRDAETYQLDSVWKCKALYDVLFKKHRITVVDKPFQENLLLEFHTKNFVNSLKTGKSRCKYIETSGIFWQPFLPIL